MTTFRHWTAAQRVPSILATGVNVSDSNLDQFDPSVLRVVWLLPPDVDPGTGEEHGLYDAKRTGWVDVDVPAIRWLDWAPASQMDSSWRESIIRAGGGESAAATWYVWPAPIPARRIVGSGVTS